MFRLFRPFCDCYLVATGGKPSATDFSAVNFQRVQLQWYNAIGPFENCDVNVSKFSQFSQHNMHHTTANNWRSLIMGNYWKNGKDNDNFNMPVACTLWT